jgi:Secretion system C-terminal sorting domain
MKNRLSACLLLAFLFLFGHKTHAQFVTIPDTNFVNWLDTSGYGACMNGNQMDTTCSAILNAQAIYCNAIPISNLTGIQYFKSLYFLNCAGDSLTTIPALPASLGFLTCQNNKLSNLPALPAGLTNLICSFNRLSSLPTLPSSLITFSCNNNQLTSLPSLPASVEDLSCGYNRLISLPSFSPSLKSLNCQNNPQLACLPQLYNMSYINIDSTAINCLPNYFQVNNSVPPLDTFQLCSAIGSGCPSFTAVTLMEDKINWRLHPNPAHEYVILETDENYAGKRLEITDITGRVISSLLITNSEFRISTANFEPGVYLILIKDTDSNKTSRKLVINR